MTSEELVARYVETLRDTFGFKEIKWYDKDIHEVELEPLTCCSQVRKIPWKRTNIRKRDHYHKVEYCAIHEIAHVYTKHIKFMEDLK